MTAISGISTQPTFGRFKGTETQVREAMTEISGGKAVTDSGVPEFFGVNFLDSNGVPVRLTACKKPEGLLSDSDWDIQAIGRGFREIPEQEQSYKEIFSNYGEVSDD
ncbi:MAG: hypothetical protein AB7P76_09775 [Candidatus Melainabacteria bacterium]